MYLNTNFMLKEANQRMRENEVCAATDDALRELRHVQPSLKQFLAHTLVELAIRLEPNSYPVRSECTE